MPGQRREVVCMGEAMLRLGPPYDTALENSHKFMAMPGGAELNTATALAALGVPVAWISALPNNPLGRFIANAARRHGVDTSDVVFLPDYRLGIYFVEYLRSHRKSSVFYDRQQSAINYVESDAVNWQRFQTARLVHLSGITPALSAHCLELTQRAISTAKSGGAQVSFDVNYRSKLWMPEQARKCLEPLLADCDIIFASAGDMADIFGITGEPEAVAEAAAQRYSAQVVAITLGGRGSLAYDGQFHYWPGRTAPEIDRFGAGDAFDAGLLYGILQNNLDLGMRYAGAMACLKHTMRGYLYCGGRDEVEFAAARLLGAQGSVQD